MSAEHWWWWAAGALTVAFVWACNALWSWLDRADEKDKRWLAGYDAGVRAVKASRSRAAKAGHETRRAKRDTGKWLTGDVVNRPPDAAPARTAGESA